ncbi:MAG: Rrf2 family transcriptional regulator [Saprospiraceae bacterium]|nr:Rrf2 family transcriptional regulator [Saprospiraceae bacterium]
MISKRCKYAIKAILYIARHQYRERPIFSTEIATEEHIPQKFLESILRDLRNHSILISKRGRNGGYQLHRDPGDINLIEIIRIMDGPIALQPCVSLKYYAPCEECISEKDCVIRQVFIQVRDATLDIFHKATVARLTEEGDAGLRSK